MITRQEYILRRKRLASLFAKKPRFERMKSPFKNGLTRKNTTPVSVIDRRLTGVQQYDVHKSSVSPI